RRLRLQDMMEMFRGRSAMIDEESPFVEEMKDSTMLKRKGGILMVYLASLVGVERLEAIIAEFLNDWRYRPAPYPTADDFLSHLRDRIDKKYHPQIADIFDHITTWHLAVVSAKCEETGNGRWAVNAIVEAEKYRTTGWGERTEVSLETPIALTAFTGRGFAERDILHTEKRSLPSGRSEVRMIVDRRPSRFGIDPYLLLPDRNPHDNVRPVQ
ncbi:MAG: hypothetical protein AAF497_25790, partial [Planctomycetota bacterium]